MRGGEKPIHIQRWAPADLWADEHWKVLVRRRDYRTMSFYRTFIDHAFMGGGDLPADSETLAAVLYMPRRDVEKGLEFCLGRLIFQDGDRLYQNRVRREVAGELAYRQGKSKAGKESAKKRWNTADDAVVEGTRAQRLAAARNLGTHTEEEWEAVVAFTGRRCLACLAPASDLQGGDLTRDHILMISRGGSDGIENIQPLCRNCNTRTSGQSRDYRLDVPGFAEWFAREMPNRRLTGSRGTPNPPLPLPAPAPLPAPLPAPDATGQATASDPPGHPLVPDRPAMEAECLRLVREVAALRGQDPTEVMGEAGTWNGRRQLNPASMSADRLLNTVIDLRRMRDGKSARASPTNGRAQERKDGIVAMGLGGLDAGPRMDEGDRRTRGELPESGSGSGGSADEGSRVPARARTSER